MMMIFVSPPFACKSNNTTILLHTQYLRFNKPTTCNDCSFEEWRFHYFCRPLSFWAKVGVQIAIESWYGFGDQVWSILPLFELPPRLVKLQRDQSRGSNFSAGKMDQTWSRFFGWVPLNATSLIQFHASLNCIGLREWLAADINGRPINQKLYQSNQICIL